MPTTTLVFTAARELPEVSAQRLAWLDVEVPADIAVCAGMARRVAVHQGLGARRSSEIALVVSELASNILKYGQHGRIELRLLAGRIEVWAFDEGPGFVAPELCVQDGYSAGAFVRPEDRRLGYGLGTVARLMHGLQLFRDRPDRLKVRTWLELRSSSSKDTGIPATTPKTKTAPASSRCRRGGRGSAK